LEWIVHYDEKGVSHDAPQDRFCEEILYKKVSPECESDAESVEGAICTPNWHETGGFCQKASYSQKLGIGAFIACGLYVLAVLLHDLTDILRIPLVRHHLHAGYDCVVAR